MNPLRRLFSDWRKDPLLGRVVRNSGYLLGSNTLAAGLAFVQGILSTRLVGVDGYGLVATVLLIASNLHTLFSFRMSEIVVKRVQEAQAAGRKTALAAAVKAAGLAEGVTSLLAFGLLVALAPLAARVLVKDPASAPWIVFYGLTLLGNLVYETGNGVLQAARRFDRLARIKLTQSILTIAVVAAAFVANIFVSLPYQTLILAILAAYLLGKLYAGLSVAARAWDEMNALTDPGWWRVPLRELPDPRGMFAFAVNTNLNGTVNLLTRDSIPLFVAGFLDTTAVGYLKLAQGLVNLIQITLDPFIWPTYAEITDTLARRLWDETRRLLRRVSGIALAWVLAVGAGLAVVGPWLIPLLYTAEAAPAYPALLILLAGYGFASVFQWNRPLLLALGRPGVPLLVQALVGLVEVGLIVLLVPRFGYLMAAGVLSGYFVLSIGIIVLLGMREMNKQAALPPASGDKG